MKIHELKPAPGSKQPKRRVAARHRRQGRQDRGPGQQGPGPRGTIPAGFEGGQTPLHRRTPKAKGFNNPFRIEYHVVNLPVLESFDSGAEVSPDTLRAAWPRGEAGSGQGSRSGELSKPLTVKAHGFSKAAIQAIEAAGGSVEKLPLPWKTGRPPPGGTPLPTAS